LHDAVTLNHPSPGARERKRVHDLLGEKEKRNCTSARSRGREGKGKERKRTSCMYSMLLLRYSKRVKGREMVHRLFPLLIKRRHGKKKKKVMSTRGNVSAMFGLARRGKRKKNGRGGAQFAVQIVSEGVRKKKNLADCK